MDRREQLVQALGRLAARDGHLDAPVVEIARSAGLAPGLVHYYFPRKLDLVLALVDHLAGVLETRLAGRRGLEPLLRACLGRGDDEVRAACGAAKRRLGAAHGAALGDDPELALGAVALVLGLWQIGAADPEGMAPGAALEIAGRLLGCPA